MKKLFSSRVTHVVLAFLALALIGAIVWFLGPLLSFGGMTPLASVGMRVTVIVMLLALLLSILLHWPLHIAGVAALCLLIWHAGPLLAIGNMHPLASGEARGWAIAVILVGYVLYGMVRLYLAVKADKDFMAKLFHIDRDKQPGHGAGESIKNVTAKVNQAMTQLKAMRSHSHSWLRLLEGKRYLYDLPWYVVLGNSGIGKTTAIHHAGLKFPLAGYQRTAGLIEGTANCDWSFTNDAVFIDTAGRYASQESHADSKVNDAAEWQGFIDLLRKHRPRAPINGVILTISVEEIVTGLSERMAHALALRTRLEELRADLGIRFPVYVMITQADRLSGFVEYFQSLTSEGRAQVWGCTLPVEDGQSSRDDTMARLHAELDQLSQRLKAGISARHQEEFEEDRRRLLLALASEFDGLLHSLRPMLEVLLQESRFDSTQSHNTVRGVYLTSAIQVSSPVPANANTLVQRFLTGLGMAGRDGSAHPQQIGANSYFLHDFFTKLIIPESHLVRPNLRWEFRFRMMKLVGHALCIVLVVWLAASLSVSFAHNRDYLATVTDKAGVLKSQLTSLFARTGLEQSQEVPDTLTTAAELPLVRGLDLQEPGFHYRVGLYSAPPVVAAADITYTHLQDSLLLPQLLHRIEVVLRQSIRDGTKVGRDRRHPDGNDNKLAYDTLRVYLQLHDKSRFNAADVKAWVFKDWESSDSAAVFGARASMLGHVERLFSGSRTVQSPFVRDEELVRSAREFLSANSSTERLYERAKTAMLREAPEEFTLTRAVGPQAGTVFSRASGEPLDKGIPGLFTYDGYHQLFDKRLSEFVAHARDDDGWVMGKVQPVGATLQKKTLKSVGSALPDLHDDPLTQDIRRQYLNEYARLWTAYLDDVHAVTGTSIAFDLTVLRAFAAPDSPLARLSRAAVRETTLLRPFVSEPVADKTLLDKVSEPLSKKTGNLRKGLGILPQERMERDLVDNQFAALREVVTGQADLGTTQQQAPQGKPALENIAALVNQYYTLMVVADTALSAGSLPPGSTEAGMNLKVEAGKLPAPFKSVLTQLADGGSAKITEGALGILRVQARTQFDRIVGMLAIEVGEPCKRGIEGRYPFAQSNQDVNIDDFTRVFAVGGAADVFFTSQLAPFVDTSVRPWRYKNPATASLLSPAEIAMAGTTSSPLPPGAVSAPNTPTLLGELLTMLAQRGPDPNAFAKMQTIRDTFFREPGSKKMAWKVDMHIAEMDPTIVELLTDIDGQTQRYVHGPVQAQTLSWPGPRGGSMAEVTAMPRVRSDTSSVMASGPWALFRLMDKASLSGSVKEGKITAEFNFDDRRVVLDLNSGGLPMPFNSDLLRNFSCPGSV